MIEFILLGQNGDEISRVECTSTIIPEVGETIYRPMGHTGVNFVVQKISYELRGNIFVTQIVCQS